MSLLDITENNSFFNVKKLKLKLERQNDDSAIQNSPNEQVNTSNNLKIKFCLRSCTILPTVV